MMKDELVFISLKKNLNEYAASISLEGFLSSPQSIEPMLKKASIIYKNSVSEMQKKIEEINSFRNNRSPLPASEIWILGDLIFDLVNELSKLSFQIDNIYEHLERDLYVKRKWLEKVIIFRRYISDRSKIPEYLNWGKCEKGTRRIAEGIQKGIIPS